MASFDSIEPGWKVYGSDDQQIGTVHVAGDDYLEVEKGTFFIKDLFVPRSAVQEVDPDQRRATLNATRDAVGEMGWIEPPTAGTTGATAERETWGQGTIDGAMSGERSRETELVGGGVDRMSSARIEEPADELSTARVPTEPVDEETLEVWSEPGDAASLDDQPRLGG